MTDYKVGDTVRFVGSASGDAYEVTAIGRQKAFVIQLTGQREGTPTYEYSVWQYGLELIPPMPFFEKGEWYKYTLPTFEGERFYEVLDVYKNKWGKKTATATICTGPSFFDLTPEHAVTLYEADVNETKKWT